VKEIEMILFLERNHLQLPEKCSGPLIHTGALARCFYARIKMKRLKRFLLVARHTKRRAKAPARMRILLPQKNPENLDIPTLFFYCAIQQGVDTNG
jgi:hypothetical protein